MNKFLCGFLIPIVLVANYASADNYQVYFPDTKPGMIKDGFGTYYTNLDIVLVNNDTRVVKTIDADDYILKFDNDNAYNFGSTAIIDINGTSPVRSILDFKGSAIKVRESQMVIVQDNNGTPLDTTDDGDQLYYDRILEIDVTTGDILSEKLIATSTAAKNYAEEAGLTVDTVNLGDVTNTTQASFTSYAENVTNAADSGAVIVTQGNFSTAKITDADGTSLFRQEDDGTIHIGENSIILADEAVSNSGYDQISSSSNVLELGSSAAHRTIVTGTLEVQEPTASNHAATKGYVDVKHAATKKYIDGNAAMSAAIASMPTAPLGKSMLTAGMGHRNGSSAIAVGYTHTPESGNKVFNLSISHSSHVSKPTYGGGIGWSF